MNDLEAYLWVAIGAILAVIFPVIPSYVVRVFVPTAGGIPPWVKKYAALLLFGFVVAAIVLAWWKMLHPAEKLEWYSALMLGFAWESAVEKIALGLHPPRRR
jgi:hypothetical protein